APAAPTHHRRPQRRVTTFALSLRHPPNPLSVNPRLERPPRLTRQRFRQWCYEEGPITVIVLVTCIPLMLLAVANSAGSKRPTGQTHNPHPIVPSQLEIGAKIPAPFTTLRLELLVGARC